MRFIGWVIRVIQGWYNWLFTKPNEETLRRRKICKTCKWNKHNVCSVCGCGIPMKCASPNEECLMGFWNV